MISTIKKSFSYFFPITKKVHSFYNGELEITYTGGEKILNTKNANYSFGSLHKIMQFALYKISIKSNHDILLLGLGGGSAIKIIRNEILLSNHIDIVDIDQKIIDVSKKEFGLNNYSDISIYCQNAFDFIKNTDKKYGVIIIDLFIDTKHPENIYEYFFWLQIISLTKRNGFIIFNTFSSNNTIEKIKTLEKTLSNAGFKVFTYLKVEKLNTVIIAKKI